MTQGRGLEGGLWPGEVPPQEREVIIDAQFPHDYEQGVMGHSRAVDGAVIDFERRFARDTVGTYAITEACTPEQVGVGQCFTPRVAPERPWRLSPGEVQRITISAVIPEAMPPHARSELLGALAQIGVFTCADALALGGLQIQQRSYLDERIRMRDHVGDGRLRLLREYIQAVTGLEIQRTVDPEDWPTYYDDIGEASLALALPSGDIEHFTDLGLGIGRVTIGNLLQARIFSARQFALEPSSTEALRRHASTVVVPRFNRHKAGQAERSS